MHGKQWIFLAPCSSPTAQRNLTETVIAGVNFTDVERFLDDKDKIVLQKKGLLRVWGTVRRKLGYWEAIENGDVVLFYQFGKFTQVGKLIHKVENETMSKKLWGLSEWRYILFLEDIREIDLPLSLIIDYSEYDHSFVPIGFMAARSEAMQRINQAYGSVENFVKAHERALAHA